MIIKASVETVAAAGGVSCEQEALPKGGGVGGGFPRLALPPFTSHY